MALTGDTSSTHDDVLADCFVWPCSDCPQPQHGAYACEEDVPTIDLSPLLATTRCGSSPSYDDESICKLASVVGEACRSTGVFQVINHGVDLNVIKQVHQSASDFFGLPDSIKLRASRETGSSFGFAGLSASAERFKSKCPWKETLSLQYTPSSNIEEHVRKIYGPSNYQQYSAIHEEFCQAVNKLGKQLVELIARSLGLPLDIFNNYFDRGFSIYRLNMYPASTNSSQLLGTGPHTDPCALTILHQDDVGGLQIYQRDTWLTVKPRSDAMVITIGDTFQVLCNHRYKSIKHRAVVHATRPRQSLVYFINPAVDQVIKPLPELVSDEEDGQRHAEFSWGQLLDFTHKYRTEVHTLESFEKHLRSKVHS